MRRLCALVLPLILCFTISNLPLVSARVEVSSPIQNKTYFTNDVPLSFNYSTYIINSSNIGEYSVVFVYNLDGEPIFDMFGNPVFGGKTTRIGQFYPPVPLDYTLSIDVPNGNHSVFVLVTFWIEPHGEIPNTTSERYVSQVVNFTVSAEPPIPEFPSWIILPLFLVATLVIVFLRKRLKEAVKEGVITFRRAPDISTILQALTLGVYPSLSSRLR